MESKCATAMLTASPNNTGTVKNPAAYMLLALLNDGNPTGASLPWFSGNISCMLKNTKDMAIGLFHCPCTSTILLPSQCTCESIKILVDYILAWIPCLMYTYIRFTRFGSSQAFAGLIPAHCLVPVLSAPPSQTPVKQLVYHHLNTRPSFLSLTKLDAHRSGWELEHLFFFIPGISFPECSNFLSINVHLKAIVSSVKFLKFPSRKNAYTCFIYSGIHDNV